MPNPRGDCYQAAYNKLMELPANKGAVLCHGTVTSTHGTLGHAWVESPAGGGIVCIDVSNGLDVMLPQSEFYDSLKACNVTQYDWDTAFCTHGKTCNFGPWKPSEIAGPPISPKR